MSWIARLHHDLVKRVLWPARDRSAVGGVPAPGELGADLVDGEGRPATAAKLWAEFRSEAPAQIPADELAVFGEAIGEAGLAAEAGDVEGVLRLEVAFLRLARFVEPEGASP